MIYGDRDGHTYSHDEDYVRLNQQAKRVFDVMASGAWYSLRDISDLSGDPEASVSARLRDFRKVKFGGWIVDRERHAAGRFLYRLTGKKLRTQMRMI